MINTSLIGVPLDLGAKNLGVDIGPDAFRYQGVIEKLEKVGFKIDDLGDIKPKNRNLLKLDNPKLRYLEEIVKVSEETAQKVETEILKNKKIIVLGGDHSVCLGAVSGASVAYKYDLGLIYFDAHGDLNTDETTITGNIHGMQLASLLGFGNKKLSSIRSSKNKIDKQHLIHIAGSDFDEAENILIEKENLNCFRIINILSEGFSPIFKSIDNLSKSCKNIWVSLDLDSIDAMYAPAAGMPNRAGLSYREVTTLFEYIGKQCNVVGIDIVEYNPLEDINGKTAELSIELIAKIFGSNYSWYTNYLERNKM